MSAAIEPTGKRFMFRFWLDTAKELESELIHTIRTLKKKRHFAATVRDGIRLVCDLRQGKTDVLEELFPWVLQHQIMVQPVQPQALPAPQTPHQLGAPDLKWDGDLEITRAKSDENSAYNLQISSLGMGMLRIEEMAHDVLEYGLQKNKFSGVQAQQARAILGKNGSTPQPVVADKPDGLKTITGADVPLSGPNLDDLDLDL